MGIFKNINPQDYTASPSIALEKGIARLRAPSAAQKTSSDRVPQPRFLAQPSSPRRYGAGPASGFWPKKDVRLWYARLFGGFALLAAVAWMMWYSCTQVKVAVA